MRNQHPLSLLARLASSKYRRAVRVYVNTSALHRPFDDMSQTRIREEAEAVTMVISAIRLGRVTLVSSEYLVFEVTQNPNAEQVGIMLATLSLAHQTVKVSRPAAVRAEALEDQGLRGLDAVHIACAEAGHADLLVTTDTRMWRRARTARLGVRVVTPFEAVAMINEELQ
jgi:predicted nucleic acid-binding protein